MKMMYILYQFHEEALYKNEGIELHEEIIHIFMFKSLRILLMVGATNLVFLTLSSSTIEVMESHNLFLLTHGRSYRIYRISTLIELNDQIYDDCPLNQFYLELMLS